MMMKNKIIATKWIESYMKKNGPEVAEVLQYMLQEFEREQPETKVVLVKAFDDGGVYGEEYIKVFLEKDDANAHMRSILAEDYGCRYEDIPAHQYSGADFTDEYVCDGPPGGPYKFWVLEEKEVNYGSGSN